MLEGGCHCGAIRYRADGEILHNTICHCGDCRRAAGAPMVGWIAFKTDDVTVTQGAPKEYASSDTGRRFFCADCGTGLLCRSEQFLPGITDIQTATLDDPDAAPPGAHIQYAEHLRWTEVMADMPKFDRYPG